MADIDLFAMLSQCGGEGDSDMKVVACVVMNRVRVAYGEYARYNSLNAVIYQTEQLNCVRTVPGRQQNLQNVYNMNLPQVLCGTANRAVAGNHLPSPGEALWFSKPYSTSCRNFFLSEIGYLIIRVNNHCFYISNTSYAST